MNRKLLLFKFNPKLCTQQAPAAITRTQPYKILRKCNDRIN